MTTEWKTIPGAERYEASRSGHIRVAATKHVLARKTDGKGYLQVGLTLERGAKRRWFRVHRLITLTFFGPCPDGEEVLHGKAGQENNSTSNLRYGTRGENINDTVADGTHFNTRKTHCRNGHEFTADNTRKASNGARLCITCQRKAGRESMRKSRASK